MTIPKIIHMLFARPDLASMGFFRVDKTLPFAVRARIINEYRRYARGVYKDPNGIPGAKRRTRSVRIKVKHAPAKDTTARGSRKNWVRETVTKFWVNWHSRGKGKVQKKRKQYRKVVSRVVHLKGTKDQWREQNGRHLNI